MKLRLVKIYIDGALVAKHMSDKPLADCITSFVRTRRIIGIHLDGRTVKVADGRSESELRVATPQGRRIVA